MPRLILSCEHASHAVPTDWREYLEDTELLTSHNGWDSGALDLAKHLSQQLNAALYAGSHTRLLVDLNRSLRHPGLHGEVIRQFDNASRKAIIETYYLPFRNAVKEAVSNAIQGHKAVLHLSVHSFTPVYKGESRNADIGLLYDPKRNRELLFCQRWQQQLESLAPHWKVRRNYPYLGTQDGHATALRRQFSDPEYAGIELEVNQQLVESKQWRENKRLLCASLSALLSEENS